MSLKDRLESTLVFTLAVLALCVFLPVVILAFTMAILWHEPRIPIGIALSLLVVAAIALAAGGKGIAEELAVWAYSFLATGAVLMLLRRVKEGRGED